MGNLYENYDDKALLREHVLENREGCLADALSDSEAMAIALLSDDIEQWKIAKATVVNQLCALLWEHCGVASGYSHDDKSDDAYDASYNP